MILIIGVAGFIGKRVLVKPSLSGYKVRALVHNRPATLNSSSGNIAYINNVGLRDALRINLGFMPDTIRDH